ncbi:hypothetical protein N0V90_009787 [Kalmusia sp. IMI 367209]|nr:hypothetical protein N0V90_009787 [Kalmusia sp. IMI 367209]
MYLSASVLTAALVVTGVTAHPQKSKCKPFQGEFTIDEYQLYPENADFDFNTCKLYIGQLWNASLGIYDPYTKKHEVVEFPGISHNPTLNMGGVGVDKRTGLISLVANGPLEFPTNGANITGDRWLISYDPLAKKTVYQVNLTATSQGKYGGFQDVEQDPAGNTFVVGSFPGTLTKVSKDGKTVTPWYLPATINSTNKGLSGIATDGWTLLAYGDASGELWKFDTRAKTGVPTVVPVKGNHTFVGSDAIYLPPKYNSAVLLIAEAAAGVSVFKSTDGWKSADFLGTVGLAPQVFAYFGDEGLGGPGTAGSRAQFPFYDISAEVDKLVKGCSKAHRRSEEPEQAEVASWYYKGHSKRSEEAEQSEVASWYLKGHSKRNEEAEQGGVASWYYKGHSKRSEETPEVASWYYKGH